MNHNKKKKWRKKAEENTLSVQFKLGRLVSILWKPPAGSENIFKSADVLPLFSTFSYEKPPLLLS